MLHMFELCEPFPFLEIIPVMQIFVLLQVQKRSGAWFFKGREQLGLPAPLPLSRPGQSSTENCSTPAGYSGSHQGYGIFLEVNVSHICAWVFRYAS